MRILRILNSLSCGGIETVTLRSLPFLQRHGVHLDFCVFQPGGALEGQIRETGCGVFPLEKTALLRRAAVQLRRVLAGQKYDLVHSHFGFTSGAFAAAAREAGLPIVVSIHSAAETVMDGWARAPLLATLRRALLRKHRRLMDEHVTIFVGHSQANLDRFDADWRSRPERNRVIMNGTQFPAELPARAASRTLLGIGPQERVILHVGSFRQTKNHEGLLQIVRRLAAMRDDIRLMLLGGGKEQSHVVRRSQALGLSRIVQFAGQQSNVWPYYAAADVFVFPSIHEGFGNVLVEAQAAGLPVVASDTAPHREAVAPAQHRFLFPLPDYDKAAELVSEQLAAATARSNLWTKESKDYVLRCFSIERYANDVLRLYQELVPHSAASRAAA